MVPIIGGIVEAGLKIIDKVIPDPGAAAEAKLKLIELQQNGDLAFLNASRDVIVAEATSEHALTSTWRPITMLSFVALIGCYWLGLTPDLPPEHITSMFDLVKIGLGGYVVGRSAEKGIKAWKAN